MTLRVVVADDQALVRVGFCGIVAATPGFTVVGEAGNGAEAVEAAQRARPDVILMDVRMPIMDGIEATRQIIRSTGVRVLILTTFDLDDYVFAALRAGASGFLLKDTLPADLITAIRVVAAGEALLAPSVTRRLIGEFARRPPEAAAAGHTGAGHTAASAAGEARAEGRAGGYDQLLRVITDRELEVLTMVALYGLDAVTEACAVALNEQVATSAHVVNLLHRAAAPAPVAPLQVPDALKLKLEPAANCDRYDRLLRSHITVVPINHPPEESHANPTTDRTTEYPASARYGERAGGEPDGVEPEKARPDNLAGTAAAS